MLVRDAIESLVFPEVNAPSLKLSDPTCWRRLKTDPLRELVPLQN